MKLFPYWWFAKKMVPSEPFKFSDYVTRRNALTHAKIVSGSPSGNPDKLLSTPPVGGDPSAENAATWIYGLLTILDTKSSALMRLNGVMLAASSFLLGSGHDAHPPMKTLVAGSACGSALSIFLCLWVVSLDWKFLGLVPPSDGTTFDFSEELFHLQQVVGFREKCYRFAWTISLVSTIIFISALVIYFIPASPNIPCPGAAK